MERLATSTHKNRLKKLAAIMRLTDDHEKYTHFLVISGKIKALSNLSFKKKSFIGEGHGPNNLNVYRKVRMAEATFFEKIYFTDSYDLQTILWVNQYIYPIINNSVKLPKIHQIYKGEVLTAVYFDFISLKTASHKKIEKASIDLSITLYHLSTNENLEIIKETPLFLKDFTKNFIYQSYISIAKILAEKLDISIDIAEEKAKHSKCVLTHMDIHEKNVYKNKTLIDWDYFGILPIGMEAARIYFLLLVHERKLANFSIWIHDNFKMAIKEEDWAEFKNNFIFFLFVFSSKLFSKRKHLELQEKLCISLANIH